MPTASIAGTVAPGFELVRDVFAANFQRWGEVGATCCVYLDGRPVVDLTGGRFSPDSDAPYRPDTLQMVASATKGALAIAALRLVERGVLDLDAPVAAYWPEFAAAGKADVPVRWLLSHRAGLPKVDADLTLEQLYRWEPLVEALAAQAPVWAPGTAHGYHALTFGSLVGEVLTRASGLSPGELIRKEIAEPLGIDVWVGLPAELVPRVSSLLRSIRDPGDAPDPLMLQLADPTSLAYGAFFMNTDFMVSMNVPALWQAQIPAANGMSNARSLARMYAACTGEVDGVRLLAPETLHAAVLPQSEGIDRVLTYQSRFGLGFQLPSASRPMSGPNCFGHYGLGGSTGFADLDRGFTFGYVVNQMRSSSAPDPRSSALITALLACL
ncbi:serine hydrolase [Sporichthya sp.]|uniref:serine hydrolase domain-containing protein n=1 Tax=Sporichthya sp. TaxID=65475 RepID=UPI0017EBB65F|nr:serine hydrolase domain-containing protein [Sporichthya sp.]MBA3742709.1 beta-lactamase family protein [Sporichthya sp.]